MTSPSSDPSWPGAPHGLLLHGFCCAKMFNLSRGRNLDLAPCRDGLRGIVYRPHLSDLETGVAIALDRPALGYSRVFVEAMQRAGLLMPHDDQAGRIDLSDAGFIAFRAHLAESETEVDQAILDGMDVFLDHYRLAEDPIPA